MQRSYAGNAKTTTLAGGISAAAMSITVADGTGYPLGTDGPFVVTIDAGLAGEEKLLVATRTGNTLSVQERGWDDTAAADHDNGASVQHTISATDLREANEHVNDTTGDPHPQYLRESRIFRYGQSIDLPSLPANSATDVVVTTTASTVTSSSSVVLYQTGISNAGVVLQRIASVGPDTFTLRVLNTTASTIDPTAATFVFLVVNP